MPRQIEFTRHLFATHTYSRDYVASERWARVSKDYNRFIQEFRRFHKCNIEYLRVIESHKDGYPHLHSIIQFPDARIRVENTRYFTKDVYEKWRTLWKQGHSDYQKPRRSGHRTLSYVLKYLIKNQTKRTIWRKVMEVSQDTSKMSTEQLQPKTTCSSAITATDATTQTNGRISSTTRLPVRINGLKMATWSRGFDFSVFSARRPESIVKGLKT